MILILISCQNTTKETVPAEPIVQNFGMIPDFNDSLSVTLQLDQFEDFEALIERTEAIACNDSLPKITLKHQNEITNVYLRNPCWKKYACILIKQKNSIEIHNDTIHKLDEHFYPLDSLTNVLRRDLENNGKIPHLCDSPEKLLIYVSYDENGIEKLPNILHLLTKAYKDISGKTDLKIWLHNRISISEMPPPPPEPEEIELMEEED
ncbi:hypothetical protein [Kordia jejudonensis]|uniref:hypothetical protein n=1 Tax=Kordia jejudonensis TaxID=1348245 RepID=UPI00138DD7B6|nr:hypothetical protein [Kordia jejudonensis]